MLIAVLVTVSLLMVVVAMLALQTRISVADAQERTLKSVASTESLGALASGRRLAGTDLLRVVRDALPELLEPETAWYLGDPASAPARLRELGVALQPLADTLGCPEGVRLYLSPTACGDALPEDLSLPSGRLVSGAANSGRWQSVQAYELPLLLLSETRQDQIVSRQISRGTLRLRLGRGSLSSYALIEGEQATPFSSVTVLRGDVQINGLLALSGRPRFMGMLLSASCTAMNTQSCTGEQDPGIALSGGFERLEDLIPHPAAPCYPSGECPQLEAGMDLEAPFVSLGLDLRTQAQSAGLLLTGDQRIQLEAGPGGGTPSIGTTLTACAGPLCQTFFRSDAQPSVLRELVGGVWLTRSSSFNGVVYVDGKVSQLGPITAFSPALSEQRLTLAAQGDLRLQGVLRLLNPPCSTQTDDLQDRAEGALCLNLEAGGLLGLVSERGDLVVAEDAPANLDVSASVVLPLGQVRFERNTPGAELAVLGSLASRHGYAGIHPLRVEYDTRLAGTLRPAGFSLLTQNAPFSLSLRLEGAGQ